MGNVNTEIIGRRYGCISLHPHEELVIMELLLEHAEKSLAEMADSLYIETGSLKICSTLCRYLKRNGVTRKKVCGNRCRFCHNYTSWNLGRLCINKIFPQTVGENTPLFISACECRFAKKH